MNKTCESLAQITPRLRVQCDKEPGHYDLPPESRQRHRRYIGGPADIEITWEDSL